MLVSGTEDDLKNIGLFLQQKIGCTTAIRKFSVTFQQTV